MFSYDDILFSWFTVKRVSLFIGTFAYGKQGVGKVEQYAGNNARLWEVTCLSLLCVFSSCSPTPRMHTSITVSVVLDRITLLSFKSVFLCTSNVIITKFVASEMLPLQKYGTASRLIR